MLNLNDLTYFVVAVEQGGFAAASRRLGLPKSTISKRVAMLEEELGTRLIHRTSRAFTLTELGRDFYEHARGALIEAEAAEAVVRRRQAEPSGTVRITASVPVAQLYLAQCLPALALKFPRLQLDLDVSDRFADLAQEGVDLAIRSHFAPLPDSALVQRRLMVEAVILVAAPAYLDLHATPAYPGELDRHRALFSSGTTVAWDLAHASGAHAQARPQVAMVANESSLLFAAAAAGLGIACLPERMCRAYIASGQLAHVLPEWTAGQVTTTLVMQHRRGLLPGVRAAADFLVEYFHALP